MATTENEYYIRAILLLVEGGCYISKKVLYREHSGDINKLLNSFKRELKRELHEKQIEKLFPPNGNTIVDTWDLQMLIIVVLRLFHNSLKREDIRKLRDLKLLRNEVQAHSSSVTLDVVQYEDIKDELTDALTSLASGFGENVQQECRSFINKYTSGPLDVMSAREYLKQLQNYDVLFKQVLEKIDSSKNDICTRLNATQKCLSDDVKNVSQQVTDLEKTLIEQLQRLDAGTCRKKIKVGMHVELSLGGPTEEWILLMERTLNDVFNEAYKTSGGKFEDIKKRVEDLLEVIKQNTTINYNGSNIKCIILMFECFTYSGLLDLLQYLTSQKYQRRLDGLTETLSTHFEVDIPVTATSTISPECLQNALDDLTECEREKQETENCHSHPTDESKKSLKLAMECSSVEDLVYLWKMFQQGGAAYYLDRIADKLSEYFGKRITLSSSLNLEEFKKALEDTLESAEDADVGASNITVLIEDDSSDEDVALREYKRPQTTPSRLLIEDDSSDDSSDECVFTTSRLFKEDDSSDEDISVREFKRSQSTPSRHWNAVDSGDEINKIPKDLIKDTRIDEDVTYDADSLDRLKRSPAASMKLESAIDADPGTSKLTDLMKDVRIDQDEKDEAESLRPFGRSSTTRMKKDRIDEDEDNLFNPFMVSRSDKRRQFPIYREEKYGKKYPDVHPGTMFRVISPSDDTIIDVRKDQAEKDEVENLRPFGRSPNTMKDVHKDQAEKDEEESLRPFERSLRAWQERVETSFLPSDFPTEMKYPGREVSFLPSDKVSSKTKHDLEEYKGRKEEESLSSHKVPTKTKHSEREKEKEQTLRSNKVQTKRKRSPLYRDEKYEKEYPYIRPGKISTVISAKRVPYPFLNYSSSFPEEFGLEYMSTKEKEEESLRSEKVPTKTKHDIEEYKGTKEEEESLHSHKVPTKTKLLHPFLYSSSSFSKEFGLEYMSTKEKEEESLRSENFPTKTKQDSGWEKEEGKT